MLHILWTLYLPCFIISLEAKPFANNSQLYIQHSVQLNSFGTSSSIKTLSYFVI